MAATGPDGTWSADNIVAYIDTIKRTPAQRDVLVDLLAEQSPIYMGRSTNEVERLRGYLLASFATTGLPSAAMPYVLEELESGRNPYTVAAAARAVRGGGSLSHEIVVLLLAAIERIKSTDDTVSFDTFPLNPNTAVSTTALMELFRTVAWLGPFAHSARDTLRAMLKQQTGAFSRTVREEIEIAVKAVSGPVPTAPGTCCAHTEVREDAIDSPADGSFEDSVRDLELQDQHGTCLTVGEAFLGRPSAVAFFYTRCMNPEKCSLTITKLARLQQRLRDEEFYGKVNVAGITYDPGFDLPERLRIYGTDRGMVFDRYNRLLRTTGPFVPLQQWFDLGVGYGPVTVNRHRLDFVILDDAGRAAVTYTRRLWRDDDVFDTLTKIIAGQGTRRNIGRLSARSVRDPEYPGLTKTNKPANSW